MKIRYEIRIKKDGTTTKEFVANLTELRDCFINNDIIGVYKLYEEDGKIIKSERLKCTLKGNRISIVTLTEKLKRIKPSTPKINLKEIISEFKKKKPLPPKIIRPIDDLNKEVPTKVSKIKTFNTGVSARVSKIKTSNAGVSARSSKIQTSNTGVSARSSKIQVRRSSKLETPFRHSK